MNVPRVKKIIAIRVCIGFGRIRRLPRLHAYLGSHLRPSNKRGRMLMRHKNRQCCIAQDIAGSATENELPQSTLRIGSLDQEVTTQCVRVLQNRLTGEATVEADSQWFCWNAVQVQIVA